jgi:hypothetical protein
VSKKNGQKTPEPPEDNGIAGQCAPVVGDSVSGVQVLPWQKCVANAANSTSENGGSTKGPAQSRTSLRARARDWIPLFLENLRLYGVWTVACSAAGVHTDKAERMKEKNSKFAQACTQAIRASTDLLEASIIVRGRDGWLEPVYGKAANGEPVMVGKVRKFDGNLAIAAMRARRPEAWRENHSMEMIGPGGVPLDAGARVQIVIAGAVRASDPAPIDTPAEPKALPDTTGGS